MNISILLRHSGSWESDVRYERYISDGIVVCENISFVNLISAITAELGIDEFKKNIEVRYVVEGNSSPLCIRNDMGVKLYIEIKKHEVGFGMYPLCIDTSDKSDEEIQNFDATTSAIVCVEGGKSDAKALTIVESKIGDSYYIPEMEVKNYISDTNISVVEVKQMYKDKATLKAVMKKYKIKNSFNFKVKRSDNKSGVTAPILGNHKRKHTPNDIITDIRALYGVEISYQQAWRSKERALEMIRGKPADGYKQLPRYIYMLETVYPNSYIRMHKSEKNEFMYLFISLRPMMRGFEFCRPVVVVDASHLSGVYRGTFVSASTLDGAGCILPLAYGIVDTENDCSWIWFFQQFKNAFGERDKMCVVSDRNESIKKGAYRKEDFEKLMAKLEKIDGRVKEYLQDAGYERWSRSHATVNRGRMMTSNIAECINGCLVDARQLPVIDFLEEARILFGSWNCKNGEIASYTKETLGRRFEEILIINASKCATMKVVASSEFIFSVYEGGIRYIVCLERKTCSCGRFQHDEIPCAHAMAVLKKKNIKDVHPYCSDYYKHDALVNTYAVPMEPMPDKNDWTAPECVLKEVVLPPRYKKMTGRPRKKRNKNPDEKLSTKTNCCGRCGQEGHNIRTCTFFPKNS
ncbi:hypothetical protein KY285_036130 [Solanum tuberosum]|nr:hypothetical protein KY289_036288 [Solanum tuberosum]KAH0639544.1 hypothetical protein KY285_036130 [Solanum tuberosum]